jgi:hypothetical protein
MDIISTALEIAEEYPVFPCDVKKRPVCQGGFKAATQDPDEIERLFSTQGAALIGVPTGAISGLSVIDIDVRDGKQGEKWVKDNVELLGQTRVAETQSGGWHYYYRHSGDIRNRAGIDGCVDVRGDGGYVIFPRSIGYKWLNDNEFAPFPKQVAAQASGVAGNSLSAPMGLLTLMLGATLLMVAKSIWLALFLHRWLTTTVRMASFRRWIGWLRMFIRSMKRG